MTLTKELIGEEKTYKVVQKMIAARKTGNWKKTENSSGSKKQNKKNKLAKTEPMISSGEIEDGLKLPVNTVTITKRLRDAKLLAGRLSNVLLLENRRIHGLAHSEMVWV